MVELQQNFFEKWEKTAFHIMLVGAFAILLGPSAYGAISFLFSDAKGREIGEIFIGFGFISLMLAQTILLPLSVKKLLDKRKQKKK